MVKLQGTALAVFLVITVSYNILLTTYVATKDSTYLSGPYSAEETVKLEKQIHNLLVKYEKIKREEAERKKKRTTSKSTTKSYAHLYNSRSTNDYILWESDEDKESITAGTHVLSIYKNNNTMSQDERLVTIKKLLTILTETLENYRIPHWITRGTLLGSYREKDLIEWDVDADIGMLYDSYLEFIAIASQKNFSFPCDDCIMLLRRGRHAHVIPMKFANKTNGIYVDTFLYMRKDVSLKRAIITRWPGKCAAECTKEGFTIEWNVVFPLKKECEINGTIFYCPNDSYKYLTQWYGDLSPKVPSTWDPLKKLYIHEIPNGELDYVDEP